jgi:hypothetical protein
MAAVRLPSWLLAMSAMLKAFSVVVPWAYSTTGREPVQAALVPEGTNTAVEAVAASPLGSRVMYST